jgi:hypothetical protein
MATSVIGALRTLYAEHQRGLADTVPPGWRTVEQWARDERLSNVHVGKMLRDIAKEGGPVEMQEFRVVTGRGIRLVQHFRAKQPKGKRK